MTSLNSPAWEYCEFHAAGGRAQSSGQKAEKRDVTAEKQQLIFTGRGCKTKAEPQPATPNLDGPSPHNL